MGKESRGGCGKMRLKLAILRGIGKKCKLEMVEESTAGHEKCGG